MSRYRYDAKSDRVLVLDEKTGKWKPDRRKAKAGAPFVMPDIKEFIARATDKPVLIGSRSKLAAYQRAHNIRQCGDFKRGEIMQRRNKTVERGLAEAKKLGGGAPLTWI
jgi:hypothetical protein